MIKKTHLLLWLALVLLIFLPSLFVFFSADDWFHLRTSQISSFQEFMNFFSFSKTPQAISFYRPLPTQLFFFVFQNAFGLNPVPYHIFALASFAISLIILNEIAQVLLRSRTKAIFVTLTYGLASSNVTRIYFLSHFQEVALVLFSLLSFWSYIEPKKDSIIKPLIFFVLALLSKETAIVLPVIFFLFDWSNQKIQIKRLLPFILTLGIYLYLRLFKFGLAEGDSYIWDFSPYKTANTLFWYVVWSVGAPELLLDYIGPGLRPIARFFSDFRIWWYIIIVPLLVNIAFLIYLFVKNITKIDRKIIFFTCAFLISLSPVLFLPHHKFAVALGLPLVWFTLAIVSLLPEKGKVVCLYLTIFLFLNLSMNYLNATRHYSVGRAPISEKVYRYFEKTYPTKPDNSYFEFINDTADYGESWGSSKQIFNSTGGSELFRVLYQDANYEVYFEDLRGVRPENKQKISVSTKMFL